MSDLLAFEAFQKLLPQAADEVLARSCHAVLHEHYAQGDRAYHNLQHVAEVLSHAGEFRAQLSAEDERKLRLAIWFHDAIYDTHASDNEAQSAQLAVSWLGRLGLSRAECEVVAGLILATQHHTPRSELEKIIVDADLAILGSPPERYRQYAQAIRAEYSWVPPEAYRAGRAAVLQRFLARPNIYHTPRFAAAYEQPARANLQSEIEQLSS